MGVRKRKGSSKASAQGSTQASAQESTQASAQESTQASTQVSTSTSTSAEPDSGSEAEEVEGSPSAEAGSGSEEAEEAANKALMDRVLVWVAVGGSAALFLLLFSKLGRVIYLAYFSGGEGARWKPPEERQTWPF